jgi:hypothetical protein
MATATKNRISRNGTSGDLPIPHAPEKVSIIRPDLRTFEVKLRGITPLIEHRFSEKAKESIKDKQGHKAAGPKGKRDPDAEYLSACYVLPGPAAGEKECRHGIPVAQIKASCVGACRYIDGFPMTLARGAFQIIAEEDGMVELHFDSMKMVEHGVRINNGKSFDLRYRPEYSGWWCKVKIRYNAGNISAEQIVNLMSIAGFHCGLAELRPASKSGPGYSYGQFEVETTK